MSMWCGPDRSVGVFFMSLVVKKIIFAALYPPAQAGHPVFYLRGRVAAMSHLIVIRRRIKKISL